MFDLKNLFKKKEKKKEGIKNENEHLPSCKCYVCVAKRKPKSKDPKENANEIKEEVAQQTEQEKGKKKSTRSSKKTKTTEQQEQQEQAPIEESIDVESIPVEIIENDVSEKEKRKKANGNSNLDNDEVEFVKRLFKRWNKNSFWDKFWTVFAILLVLGMFYLIYLFLRTAGTIPFTHWRFK